MRRDVSALVLAGGRATRLGGIDKRAIVVEGRTIFERQLAVLAPRVAEVLVSIRAGADARPGAHEAAGCRTVMDAVPDAGPLAGVAAGLAAAATPWLLVIAGDMPYITGPLVDLVLSRIGDDRDAVGLRVGGLPEPLVCALRCATCATVVQHRVASGQRKASRLLTDGELRVCWIEEPELRTLDPELRSLLNVNAPEDLGSC